MHISRTLNTAKERWTRCFEAKGFFGMLCAILLWFELPDDDLLVGSVVPESERPGMICCVVSFEIP